MTQQTELTLLVQAGEPLDYTSVCLQLQDAQVLSPRKMTFSDDGWQVIALLGVITGLLIIHP